MKRALITGVTGQDGAYLSKLLLSKGYKVFGTYRRTSSVNTWRLDELDILSDEHFNFIEYDLTDMTSAIRLIDRHQPDEIYNLAAQSFVGVSFEQPLTTSQITGLSVLNILEAIRILNKDIKFYQASTSEMFGCVQAIPQNEDTSFYPRSPYGVAKLYAHWMTINYRESYNIFGTSGILFNHESPLRGLEFVTRKITDSVAKISLGKMDYMELGNLDAKRDWGYAKDYVEMMWLMLQQDTPDDYVIATGEQFSVREFISWAAYDLGFSIEFEGDGIDTVGIVRSISDEKRSQVRLNVGDIVVRIDPRYFRPAEVETLLGDASKAKAVLGWEPEISARAMCEEMVGVDLAEARNQLILKENRRTITRLKQ